MASSAGHGDGFDAVEYEAAFRCFLEQYYSTELRQLASRLSASASSSSQMMRSLEQQQQQPQQQQPQQQQPQQHLAYSLRICAQYLLDFNASVGTLLFLHPDPLLPLFHAALAAQVASCMQQQSELDAKLRTKIKVRIEFLPPVRPLRKATISTIRSHDAKKLIQVAGTVVRTGMIKMQESSREYRCCNTRCQYRFLVKSDPEQGNILEIPRVCPSESAAKKPCKSTQFEVVDSGRVVSDHQVIKIQEQASKLGVGSIPRSILIVLEDDLVDTVKAGDHVVVVGMVMRCWKPVVRDVRCDLETIVHANSIRLTNATNANVLVTEELKKEFTTFWEAHAQDPLRGRNAIVASICPKVYGLFLVKLAVALTVIGGCSHVDATGMKTRGEPHMLLIGDPGTGKSQFLRFTAELSPRSVLTTGIGTTSAGLTCTAVKDGGEWMLEAGALVLADRGVCCIDEFSSIRSHDRTSIHEAMEQQTLSVAKAGLVCKLNARTTIFAVTNPKGRYDPQADVSVNTSIASPLLSRFDLILVLLDRQNAHWDETVSSFILKQSTSKEDDDQFKIETPASAPNAGKSSAEDPSRQWSISKLQAYICFIKEKYAPQLDHAAMMILQRYYQLQRSSDQRSAARTTIRLLESLTRIAQAHARLMMHDHVEVMDAVVAVFLMEVSQATDHASTLLGGGLASVLQSDFSEDPGTEYAVQEKLVLDYLGLSDLATTSSSSSSQSSHRYSDGYDHNGTHRARESSLRMNQRPPAFAPNANLPAKRWRESEPSVAVRNDLPPVHEEEPDSNPYANIPPDDFDDDAEDELEQTPSWSILDAPPAKRWQSESQPQPNVSEAAPPSQRFLVGRWSQQSKSQGSSVTSKWRK